MDRLAIVHRRMRAQRLAGPRARTPAEVVGRLGAVQAQEFAEVKWSIGERLEAAVDADVEAAFARGEILRTHLMRPTWHLVTPADIRWIQRLTGPRVHAANRYWYRQVELEPPVLEAGCRAIAAALEDGEPRTRAEVGAALERAGIAATGVRLGSLLMYAEVEQLICSGPRRGKQHTYALLDARAPRAVARRLSDDDALAELTRRYFSSHGPATARDFSWWSGLTLTTARAGLDLVAGELEVASDEDGTPWYAAPDEAGGGGGGPLPEGASAPHAHLIPMYDELGVAYKDLRMVMAIEPPRAGLLDRPILLDGATVGSWRRTLASRSVTVEATLFGELDRDRHAALSAAVERFGRFLGVPASLAAGRPA